MEETLGGALAGQQPASETAACIERLLNLSSSSIVSQRGHRIDSCGTPRGNVTSAERDNGQKRCDDAKRQRVELADVCQGGGATSVQSDRLNGSSPLSARSIISTSTDKQIRGSSARF